MYVRVSRGTRYPIERAGKRGEEWKGEEEGVKFRRFPLYSPRSSFSLPPFLLNGIEEVIFVSRFLQDAERNGGGGGEKKESGNSTGMLAAASGPRAKAY